MQVKKVDIKSLKGASYNPEDRTATEGNTKLGALQRSIEQHGLVYPVAVSKEMKVIDGHRRLQCCKNLGWTEIPVLVVETNDPDAIYAEVNAYAMKLDGYQTLQVWLKQPSAVTEWTQNAFKKLEEQFGRDLLERVAKARMSIRVIQTAMKVGRYVDDTESAFVKRAVRWLMKYRAVQIASAYMRLQQPPAALFNAIEKGKELKTKFTSR